MRIDVQPGTFSPSVLVTKRSAAQSQLETAILLWFNGGDPVSIHTLAVAAHDLFHELAKQTGKPSDMRTWLASKSKKFQNRAHAAQNFFKHGALEPKKGFRYEPIYGEMLMMDCVTCWHRLWGKLSPSAALFRGRFLLEHPDVISDDARDLFLKSIGVHKVTGLSRSEFFEKLFSGATQYLASKK